MFSDDGGVGKVSSSVRRGRLSRGVLPAGRAADSLDRRRGEGLRAADVRVVVRRTTFGRLADFDGFFDPFLAGFLDVFFDVLFAGFRGVLAFFAARPAFFVPPLAFRLAIVTTPSVTLTVSR
jgi:hypothetical protein